MNPAARHIATGGGEIDAVSSEYTPRLEWTGGRIVEVVFDVADDGYVDVERHMAAATARD